MRAVLGEKVAKCLAVQGPRAHLLLVSQGRVPQAVTFQMCLGEQERKSVLPHSTRKAWQWGGREPLAKQLVAQFGWCLSPVQQISGSGALKGKQGLYGQGRGREGFVLHLKYNRKHSRCLLREVMPGAVFWEDVYGSCGRRDWSPGGSWETPLVRVRTSRREAVAEGGNTQRLWEALGRKAKT